MKILLFLVSVFSLTNQLIGQDSVSYNPDFFSSNYMQVEDTPTLEFNDPMVNSQLIDSPLEMVSKNGLQHGKSFTLLAFMLVSLTFLLFKILNRQLYILYRNAFSNYNLFVQLLREKRSSPPLWTGLLLIARSFVFALVIYLLVNNYMAKLRIRYIGIFCLLLLLFWIAKYILAFILGVLSDQKSLVKSYSLQHHIIFTGLSVLLLPIGFMVFFVSNIIQQYVMVFLALNLIIGLFYYVSRYWRIIGSFRKDSFILFFMYFCAFEMMPLLVVAKWISHQIAA